ncbi:MAG: Asp-tRNA(Asn)/Glu-tRNA(Gln) amidotransferase subunit GatC [Ruminococcus sp.]|nr:Asp-tRNA(Asn)/Glu-tRNA(Gln) amidotransferase subunit GatC [Ruminococcus sp.]
MDIQTFENVAELGKLTFSEEERGTLLADMNEIVLIMDTVKDVDITYDPILDNRNRYLDSLREDISAPSFETEKILSNAKASDGCFTVPKVVE